MQAQTARRTRAAVAALVACVLLSSAAVAVIGHGNGAVELVDEVDGLELNAYLTPNDVEEFKKVSLARCSRVPVGSVLPSSAMRRVQKVRSAHMLCETLALF